MLKKIYLHNPSDMACKENRLVRCSTCKTMEKPIFYFCKSGRHILCEDCRHIGSLKNRNELSPIGDHIPERDYTSNSKPLPQNNNTGTKRQDLASGDHFDAVETFKIIISNEEVKKGDTLTTSTPKKHCTRCNVETTLTYKNDNFGDSKSSDVCYKNVLKENLIIERVPRPVKCPVADCAKMVTIDAISQHFNFDHSKVPRMILNRTGPQEILLNFSTLSTETKCLATFVTSQAKRLSQTAVKRLESSTIVHSADRGSQLLLLMAAKMSINTKKLSNSKLLTRNSYTQTEDTLKKNNQASKLCVSKSSSVNTFWTNKSNINDDDDEVVILWLCKLDDKEGVYTITVSREDKKEGYSYTGNAIHIRNEHEPCSIYKTTECLSIRKTAINKLVSTENELKVIVSTVL